MKNFALAAFSTDDRQANVVSCREREREREREMGVGIWRENVRRSCKEELINAALDRRNCFRS
jgi:hypothetical protein